MNSELSIKTSFAFINKAPPLTALLLVKLTKEMLNLLLATYIAPPSKALFPSKVELKIVKTIFLDMLDKIAPPYTFAVLLMKLQFFKYPVVFNINTPFFLIDLTIS